MTISVIFGFLKTLVQVYPIAKEIINGVYNLWYSYEAKELREQYNLKENKMAALRKAISEAKNDQDRIALSIVLHQLQNS